MKLGKNFFHARVVIFTALFFALTISVVAQPGIQEFGDAAREVKKNYQALAILLQVVGAIAGLVGGVRVYTNLQNGKHHLDGQVQGWLLGCIFFQLIAICVNALYF